MNHDSVITIIVTNTIFIVTNNIITGLSFLQIGEEQASGQGRPVIRPISTPGHLQTPSTYVDPYKRDQVADRRSNPEPYRPAVPVSLNLLLL
jgi:hypothetical protein